MTTHTVDVAIIGGGTAGMSAYREVRQVTQSIALIEAGPFGTTCARVGCMPSKLLIAPAEACHRLDVLPQFGIDVDAPRIDGRRVMQRVRAERDRFVSFVLEDVAEFAPEHIVRARATFEDRHTLRLAPADAPYTVDLPYTRIRAERIVIATGSRPAIPSVLQAAGDRLLVNDDVFSWQDLPDSIAVFGAGVIGLELGQALHRLGVRVRMFGRGGRIAGITDPQIRSLAGDLFAAEFPYVRDTHEVRVQRVEQGVEVHWRDGDSPPSQETFDGLLAATGRIPNMDQLGLEHTGLELDALGIPRFDPQTMRAGDSNIFVSGDAVGVLPVLHEASDEGRLAGENAAHHPQARPRQRRTPLAIVFSDPQVAFVGQTHAELSQRKVDFATGAVSFSNQGRSRVMLVNQGRLHIYGEQGSGRLLGAEMIGPQNEHLAHLLAWAIQSGMTVGEALRMPVYHPVIEEGLRTALRDLHLNLGLGPQPRLFRSDIGEGLDA